MCQEFVFFIPYLFTLLFLIVVECLLLFSRYIFYRTSFQNFFENPIPPPPGYFRVLLELHYAHEARRNSEKLVGEDEVATEKELFTPTSAQAGK